MLNLNVENVNNIIEKTPKIKDSLIKLSDIWCKLNELKEELAFREDKLKNGKKQKILPNVVSTYCLTPKMLNLSTTLKTNIEPSLRLLKYKAPKNPQDVLLTPKLIDYIFKKSSTKMLGSDTTSSTSLTFYENLVHSYELKKLKIDSKKRPISRNTEKNSLQIVDTCSQIDFETKQKLFNEWLRNVHQLESKGVTKFYKNDKKHLSQKSLYKGVTNNIEKVVRTPCLTPSETSFYEYIEKKLAMDENKQFNDRPIPISQSGIETITSSSKEGVSKFYHGTLTKTYSVDSISQKELDKTSQTTNSDSNGQFYSAHSATTNGSKNSQENSKTKQSRLRVQKGVKDANTKPRPRSLVTQSISSSNDFSPSTGTFSTSLLEQLTILSNVSSSSDVLKKCIAEKIQLQSLSTTTDFN